LIPHFGSIALLRNQQYERYLPSAFDESMTLVQKVNMVIEHLNVTMERMNDLQTLTVDAMNEQTVFLETNIATQYTEISELYDAFQILKEWLENEGLEDRLVVVLNDWFDTGKLAEIINNEVFNMKADQIDLDSTNEQLAEIVKKITISVTDFGAKGDGITDDSIAINQAVGYAQSLATDSHVSVIFPTGTYKTQGIDISNKKVNLITYSSAKDGATLIPFSVNQTYLVKTGYNTLVNYQSVIGFKFTVFTLGGFGGNYTGCAILTGDATINTGEGLIQNCWISMGSMGTGIKGRMWDTRIENCWIDGNRVAINITNNSNRVIIDKCTFYDNALQDILFDQTTTTPYNGGNGFHRITNCHFMGVTRPASTSAQIDFRYSQNVYVAFCDFGQNLKKAIRFQNVTNFVVKDCKFYDDLTTPMKIGIEIVLCAGNLVIDGGEIVGLGDNAINYTNNVSMVYNLLIQNVYFKGCKAKAINTFSTTNNTNEITVKNCTLDGVEGSISLRIGDDGLLYSYVSMTGNKLKNCLPTVSAQLARLIGNFVNVSDNYFGVNGSATTSIDLNNINVKGFVKGNIFNNALGVANIVKSATPHANIIISDNLGNA